MSELDLANEADPQMSLLVMTVQHHPSHTMDTADTDSRSSDSTSSGFSPSTSITIEVTPTGIASGPLQPPVDQFLKPRTRTLYNFVHFF